MNLCAEYKNFSAVKFLRELLVLHIKSFLPIMKYLFLIASCIQCGPVLGTEDTCQADCHSPDRPYQTRPWHANDPLRNGLHLTRPYPYHIAANDKDKYSFSTFCELGCTYFFTSSSNDHQAGGGEKKKTTTTLECCLTLCDDRYTYDSSNAPPYNDLAAMARLECRDGCLLALRRCQSGYYCSQITFDDTLTTANTHDESSGNNIVPSYKGGDMTPCPAGTYRDVSYNAIEECLPCPPNHFREDSKGRNIRDCSPCPAGTSAPMPGNDSIEDCVRCPAGTFSTKASNCYCITPQACAKDQLPPPADAEKKETVPYIGRW